MIISEGKNCFAGNEFDFWEWSAPILQTPEEVIRCFHELKLKGRVIKDIIAVGLGYDWREDGIEDKLYNAAKEETSSDEQYESEPKIILPQGAEVPCAVTLDEPLLLVFEDGDVLAVEFSEGSCVRMALNTIPTDIDPGINRKNFHANRLFANLIGKRIGGAEITATTEMPDFTGSYGLELEEQSCYIRTVEILLYSEEARGARYRLAFESEVDYGTVECRDIWGKGITVSAAKIPWITEGYIEKETFIYPQ